MLAREIAELREVVPELQQHQAALLAGSLQAESKPWDTTDLNSDAHPPPHNGSSHNSSSSESLYSEVGSQVSSL